MFSRREKKIMYLMGINWYLVWVKKKSIQQQKKGSFMTIQLKSWHREKKELKRDLKYKQKHSRKFHNQVNHRTIVYGLIYVQWLLLRMMDISFFVFSSVILCKKDNSTIFHKSPNRTKEDVSDFG